MEAGAIYGLANMALGGYIVDPVQALLGYPVAFSVIGLAGLFKKYPLVGVGVGISARFLVHFIEGVWFFGIYAPEGMHPIIYSALYNGGYLVVELIVSIIIMYILMQRRLLNVFLS